jgi:hypothetical protein
MCTPDSRDRRTGERHELDEPDGHWSVLGHFDKVEDFGIVEAFDDHHVELDGLELG